ncbi:hypothetical protein H4R18_003678 [Coemansia javaensis]|uniref:DSBA-like thioredoxin domain-containing protein n=1 Tax=Coemansia javaensis TaxID=2761396 RepID=A0A9W8HBG8_9FUNG|nr:hypothetical protein H4R18_003678 [Coemansia javaensis]
MASTLSFWFEYASPYSMISALRLLRALTGGGGGSVPALGGCQVPDLGSVQVVYRPVFLGAVFKAAGQPALPNMSVPGKGRYLFHDVKRTLDLLGSPGFPSSRPAHWPPSTQLAGRMTWLLAQGLEYVGALDRGDAPEPRHAPVLLPAEQTRVLAEFVWRVFEAEFIAGDDIGQPEVLARLWDAHVAAGPDGSRRAPDGQRAVALAEQDAAKSGFRASTQAAIDHGLFGAPSFTTADGDMYWGNDRLIDAVTHHQVVAGNGASSGFCVAKANI